MTEIIKMCKQDGMCIGIVGEAECWEPIDPQPSCKNCDHAIETGIFVPSVIRCEMHHEANGNYGIYHQDFYCKYWEMKG